MGLFDEEAGIFRPIYRNRTTEWMQEQLPRRAVYSRTALWPVLNEAVAKAAEKKPTTKSASDGRQSMHTTTTDYLSQ